MSHDGDEQGCGEQPFEAQLSHATPLERLSALAAEVHTKITEGEKSATPNYWQLGRILQLARKQVPRGTWAAYLATLGIEKTRASKARAIFQAFSTANALVGLSVAAAYERRSRSPLAGKRRSRAAEEVTATRPVNITLPHWVYSLESDAERLRDEVQFLTPTELASLLHMIGRAAILLTELREAARRIAGATP